MDDQDHGTGNDLVAHHGEEDEGDGNEVMKEVLVVLALSFAFDDGHFEDRECVDSELEEEVDFEFGSFLGGPIGVVFVDFGTFAAASYNGWEPIFVSEEDEGHDGGEGVEETVVAELEDVDGFPIPDFAFVLEVDQLVDLVAHQVVVAVLGDLS